MKILKSIIFGISVLTGVALFWGFGVFCATLDTCALIVAYSIFIIVFFSYAYYKVNY